MEESFGMMERRCWIKKPFMNLFKAENCWVSALFPSSGFLNTKKHNVSETGSASIRCGEGDTYYVGSLGKS
jgi:hypothetical protein